MASKHREIRCELIRTLRGKRTQGQVSRKLGFKTNQVYRWESGAQSPGWKEFTRFCRICGADLKAACRDLLKFEGDLSRSAMLAAHFLGSAKISKFSSQTGFTRFKIARWLSGESDFTLDEMLELIERTQGGLFDFIHHLTRGVGIPRFERESKAKRLYSELLREHPWASVVRVCLDLDEYQSKAKHTPGFIAAKTGTDPKNEAVLIQTLVDAGAIHWEAGKLKLTALGANIRGDHETESLRVRYWAQRAAEIFRKHGEDSKSRFQLIVYSASEEAALKIHAETIDYYTKVRAILAADSPATERVQALGIQVLDMDDFGDLSAFT